MNRDCFVATLLAMTFYYMRLVRSLQSLAMTVYCMRLLRPSRARNDILITRKDILLQDEIGALHSVTRSVTRNDILLNVQQEPRMGTEERE
jgi:hypothetical protein